MSPPMEPPINPKVIKIKRKPSRIQYVVCTDGDVEEDKKAVRKYATRIFPGEDIEVKAYEAKAVGLIQLCNDEDEEGKKIVETYAASYVQSAKEEWIKHAKKKDQIIFVGIANCVVDAAEQHFAHACFAEERVGGFQDVNYSWGYNLPEEDYKAAISDGAIKDYSFLKEYGMKREDMVSVGLLEKFNFCANPEYGAHAGIAEPLTFKRETAPSIPQAGHIAHTKKKYLNGDKRTAANIPQVKYIVHTEKEFSDDDREAVLKYANGMSPGAAITISVYAQVGKESLEDFIKSDKSNHGFDGLVTYLHIETRFIVQEDNAYTYVYTVEQHTAASQRISSSRGFEIPLFIYNIYKGEKAKGANGSFVSKYLRKYQMNRRKIVLEALVNKFSNADEDIWTIG